MNLLTKGYIAEEEIERYPGVTHKAGVHPVMECSQNIPCNPCQDACPRHCIRIGAHITLLILKTGYQLTQFQIFSVILLCLFQFLQLFMRFIQFFYCLLILCMHIIIILFKKFLILTQAVLSVCNCFPGRKFFPTLCL